MICLDFDRPIVWVAPLLSCSSSVIKGLSGMGEAIIFGAGWQLAYLAGVAETDDFGLLAVLITLQQCSSTLSLAVMNVKAWTCYVKIGMLFSACMVGLSPVGNYMRDNVQTEGLRVLLASIFLGFSLLKVVADGLSEPRFKRLYSSFGIRRGPSSGANSPSQVDPQVVGEGQDMEGCAASSRHEEAVMEEVVEAEAAEDQNDAAGQGAHSTEDYPAVPSWLWRTIPFVGVCGGFLGGICGMNGPPFILMVAFLGLDKKIARHIFPMGQFVEVWTFRLPYLIYASRVRATDLHIYSINFVAGQIGLFLGNKGAPLVSQQMFERAILTFLTLSSLSILGIIEGHPRALLCMAIVGVVLMARIICKFPRAHDI